jgi:3-hydroxyacyl-CoA dehydrogenase
MSEPVSYRVVDGVAVVTIDHPPVNALSAVVRQGLARALSDAVADPGVGAIVLAAAGRTWPAGADITEFDQPPVKPLLPDVCAALAICPKPVIAALHGTALGGGLELALAADYRLAEPGTRLGFPEVSLGILPGAGGTQRLPRLIGAKAALGMMLSGLPILAERAVETGLIDELTPGDAAKAAETLARAVVAGTRKVPANPRVDHLHDDPTAFLAAVASARKGLAGPRLPAPVRIVECVEAALLLPEDEGHAFERAAFEDLVASPQAAALRHAFLAERRAARPPELSGVLPRPLDQVGVVGAGPTGSAIVTALLSAGHAVTFVDPDATALADGLARIAARHEKAVASGALSAEAREAEWDQVTGATAMDGLSACSLVIEAADSDAEAVKTLFADLDRMLRPSTILAATSFGNGLDQIAAATLRADDVIGLQFSATAQSKRLVEIIVGSATAPAVTSTMLGLARKMGKVGVRARSGHGLISQRVMAAYQRAMDCLVEDGASPYEIDLAMRRFGFLRGPYQTLDLAGLDSAASLDGQVSPDARKVAISAQLLSAGRKGAAHGRGYYIYSGAGHLGDEDPEVLGLIEVERRAKGLTARPVSGREIRHRALAAMANEGARLLADGTAFYPSDIDMVMLAGFGFPRWRGGPMQCTDQVGLLQIRNDLRSFAREDEAFWQPAELWDDLIKNGRTFGDLNKA